MEARHPNSRNHHIEGIQGGDGQEHYLGLKVGGFQV